MTPMLIEVTGKAAAKRLSSTKKRVVVVRSMTDKRLLD
jgi:hypothetical protein